MAYTTLCTGTYSGNSNCTIYIEYQINSTSSSAHNVTFRCYAKAAAATSSYNATSSSTVSFKVGSTTVKSGTWSFDFRSAGTYLIGSTTISCSSGQSVAVSASHTSGVSLGSASCSKTVTMPTISTTTYSTITAMPTNNGASDNADWSYSFSTPTSPLTCRLVMNDPNGAGDFFEKNPVTSPQTINLGGATALWAKHPNEQYVVVSMRHCTMSGSTLKNINSTDFRVNISNANPALGTWSIKDTNSATIAKTGAASTSCIVGYSTIKVTISTAPTLRKSATFSKYEITCGSVTKTLTTSTGSVSFAKAPSNKVTVKVIDSRGLTNDTSASSAYKTLTSVSYTPVSIKNLKAKRQSTNTTVKLSWTKSGTPSSYSYKYKLRTASSWTTGATSITSTATSVTLGQTFAAGSAYDLQLTVSDGITSVTVSTVIGVYGVPLIVTNTNKLVLNQGSTQVINKAETRTDLLDYIYPVGSIYISNSSTFNPNTAWGGTWSKITGKFLLGADDSTYTRNSTGGNSALTLRALVGAINGLTDSIGYKSADAISGQTYTYAIRGTGQSSISTVNHATPVMDATQKTVTTSIMPPYKAVYIWERTA